jgi:type I restriction-modification system DNA methylase subunit/predicted type IV restriction endonuclease
MVESQGQDLKKGKSAPLKVQELVDRFRDNLEAYKRSTYNETQVRREFIDPFFASLGWDVDNERGYAEAYKDVVHEDAIKIAGVTKAPDYSFRIAGMRKFFVEAKKPAINIKEDAASAYQLRRYAWSAKLPLSILTSFDSFEVYDCRSKPDKTDKPSHSRILSLKYSDYLEHWKELVGIFSREAILKGSFDKYVESNKVKKGTAEVDTAFLLEIERWRDLLARNIALRNPRLSQRELNFAVQLTIDRIIFLRICEDRSLEAYADLMGLQNGNEIYKRLFHLFYRADDRYNSGLFHFRKEKNRSSLVDDLTPNLIIDDKVLKDIFKNLYYPDSPYEFAVLPADILGHVYEQFLGKIIRLTPGHQAKVEYKPEVRKAGGVYYTPTYIVDYIVRQTVGKLVEGKKPGTRSRLNTMRILDPACGSGSFLLGAYQFLLDWHLEAYAQDPGKWTRGRDPRIYQASGGDYKLTISERKRILQDHIFGVDIDSQAVEVTKLSLLLKVLEGEDQHSVARQLKLFQQRALQRALPDLGDNIKCGNSLIGPDFYHGQQLNLMDDEETYRVNAFDWQAEFPEIMAGGGFDAVIGNPPYIRIQTLKEWAPTEVEFYKRHYQAAAKGNYDIYVLFVEKGLGLLNGKGCLGFILPHKFFNAQYGEALRGLIARDRNLARVVHFGDQQVFAAATTYTCMLFLKKTAAAECTIVKVNDLSQWRNTGHGSEGVIPAASITAAEWNFAVGQGADLFEKLNKMPVKLGDVADIFVGLQTSADDVFILDFLEEGSNTLKLKSKSLNCDWIFEKDLLFPLISGTDVNRYSDLPERQYIIFPYKVEENIAELIDIDTITQKYPMTANYLLSNKERLESRENYKLKGKKWHGYIYLKNLTRQTIIKLCVPRLLVKLYATYDLNGNHFLDNVDVGGISLKPNYLAQGFHFILGLLNSKLLSWYFPFVSAPFRGGWISANRQFISQIPIRIIDFNDAADKASHDRLVTMVENMLALHKQSAAAKTPQEKTVLERQIDTTDRRIDQLVYELYELTKEEIKLVEAG